MKNSIQVHYSAGADEQAGSIVGLVCQLVLTLKPIGVRDKMTDAERLGMAYPFSIRFIDYQVHKAR